jgi:hypothetical protein
MVELMVTMTLLSLIVLALMAVFSSTQQAFRASVTQTDVLEGSRAAVDMITSDLHAMTPSDYPSNYYVGGFSYFSAVNFFATNNTYYYPNQYSPGVAFYQPLVQALPGTGTQRTNLLQYFFLIGRQNTKWTGAGYIVNSGSLYPLYPLYRFYAETNISANPVSLYYNFLNTISLEPPNSTWTNLSHVMDGVVHMVVRAYDPNGYWLTNGYVYNWQTKRPSGVWFSPPTPPLGGEIGFSFYSNAVPAAVELQLGVLEDRTMKRAQSLGVTGSSLWSGLNFAELNYLTNASGHVHLFRQRVTIPNVDATAYQ